jgi:DNA-binding Lrp family transcriptional regulator
MPSVLSVADAKFLYELDRAPRAGFSVLARKLQMNRNTLEYRYKRLIDEGILKGTYAIVNGYDLGYSYYKLLLKTRALNEGFSLAKLSSDKNIVWAAKTDGQYDLAVSFHAKTSTELEVTLAGIRKSVEAKEHALQIIRRGIVLDEQWLIKAEKPRRTINEGRLISPYEIDERDSTLLGELVENGRISLVHLGSKTGLTPEAVRARIKMLTAKGIIKGYKARINYAALGYDYFHVLMSVSNMQARDSVVRFAEAMPQCVFVMELSGTYDLQAEFISRGHKDVSKAIEELKARFPTELERIDSLFIIEEIGIRTF